MLTPISYRCLNQQHHQCRGPVVLACGCICHDDHQEDHQ